MKKAMDGPRLISDLLDLAKIERREVSWTMIQTELGGVVSKAVDPLLALSKARHPDRSCLLAAVAGLCR